MTELSNGRKPSTVNKYVNLICHAWRVAKREWGINLPPENPCDMVTFYKFDDTRDRVLTKDEYHTLLQVAMVQDSAVNNSGNNTVKKDRYRHMTDVIKFAYQTGARQGEILKLKREHIDFDAKTCTFYDTKNKADRTIPLADETLIILKRHVFGKFIFDCESSRLRKWFRCATRTAKISNFRFHDLRACFCTNALLNGWSIAEVSAISGHKDWSQLKRYTRIKPVDLLEKINNVVNLK
jgi:integrase